MKKIIPFIAFFCLTATTATNFPVVAGGCNSQMNKKADIDCAADDTECQTEKAKNFESNNTVRS